MAQENDIFLDAAWNIGMSLVRDGIWHRNSCNWIGHWIDAVDGKYVPVVRSFGPDFYSGTSGIAYFLSSLYIVREDNLLKKTVSGAIEQVRSRMQSIPDHGFYSGKPGLAFTLVRTGKIFGREDWITDGLNLVKELKTGQFAPYELDIISGISGSIFVLLNLYNEYKQQAFMDLAIKLGDALCDSSNEENEKCSWKTVPSYKNLTGFSHGAAGIASSLLHLYSMTGEKRYLKTGLYGLNYEQSCFDPFEQNWPDFRDGVDSDSNAKPSFSNAWCHGAPGIALSRIYAYKTTGLPIFTTQIEAALKTTTNSILQLLDNDIQSPNYSLCHGIAGNADILIESGKPELAILINSVGMAGVQKYDKPSLPWPSGLNTQKETPGMMMGLSGTGYFYLRLFDSGKNSCILSPMSLQ